MVSSCHCQLQFGPQNVISNNALPHLTSPCVPLLCSDLTFNVNPSVPFYCLTLVLIGDFPLSNLSSSRSPITGAVRVFTQLTLKSLLLHFSDYSMFPISPSLFLLPSLCIPPPSKKKIRPSMGESSAPPRDQTSSYCTIFSDQYSLVQESTEATQRYFNCLCTTLWRIT